MSQKNQSVLARVFNPGPTPDTTPLPATGRAGRNLPAAVTSGLILLTTVALALFFARNLFLVFVGILIVLATWEIAGALARKQLNVVLIPVYLGGIAMFVAGSLGSEEWVMYSMYLTILVATAWRIFAVDMPGRPIMDVMATIFTIVYIPFMASFVGLMSQRTDSPWPLVFFVVVVVCNDLGGWMAGVMFGKHPMAPKLSPKKSWEGFAGSVIMCGAAGWVATLVMGIEWWWLFVFAVAGAVLGTLGDLTESLIKRDVGLKDMSSIMPGHGGIMDRLDSLLFAAPAFFLIYSLALGW
ncbi:phosphatidate cytidylyltransferase [Actinomyces minihominis]|uniref:phosphatidate cytidylyltransferase n=1 Tax=Actinomyces minihominis TaxID=2002838 RepID=UPI000C0733B3|nr:phosphatidate cytidylyltransferase [Actinomyces minihominis]